MQTRVYKVFYKIIRGGSFMKYYFKYASPIGDIYLLEEKGELLELAYHGLKNKEEMEERKTEVLQEAKRQLDLYFEGKLRKFDLPLNPRGTDFQKKVWRALLSIPYGETRAYGEIAKQIGHGKAARAIGRANHANPIAIIIPCHRVIGKDRKMVGYAGGLDVKITLLELEGIKDE